MSIEKILCVPRANENLDNLEQDTKDLARHYNRGMDIANNQCLRRLYKKYDCMYRLSPDERNENVRRYARYLSKGGE